jgi:hypothetical protein
MIPKILLLISILLFPVYAYSFTRWTIRNKEAKYNLGVDKSLKRGNKDARKRKIYWIAIWGPVGGVSLILFLVSFFWSLAIL